MVICQHYRLQKKLLCVLEILFLGTFDKKMSCTDMLESSCHNLIDCFNIHSICYLFLHSREHIHMKCLMVYLDREKDRERERENLHEQQTFKRLCTLLFVHSCHLPFSESYYGLQNVATLLLWYNKILMEDFTSTSTSFSV